MNCIGTTAKNLRKTLGWTQSETAKALEISNVHLCNIEKNRSQPSQDLLDRYRQLWGIDLYIFHWCESGQIDKLPVSVQEAAAELSKAWQERIEYLVEHQRRDSNETCLTSDN